jgi:hypothetical protein
MIGVLLLAAVVLGQPAPGAAAGVAWCRTDPLIMVEGLLADVFVGAPLSAIFKVTGPTEIVVVTPVDADALLILSGPGFGRGEIVSFEQSPSLQVKPNGIELQIRVFLPATDDEMPVRVEFAPRVLGILWPTVAEGTANDWISYQVFL